MVRRDGVIGYERESMLAGGDRAIEAAMNITPGGGIDDTAQTLGRECFASKPQDGAAD